METEEALKAGEVNCDELKAKGFLGPPIKVTSTEEVIQENHDTIGLSQEHNNTEIKGPSNGDTALSNGETADKENGSEAIGQIVRRDSNSDPPADLQSSRDEPPPELPQSAPPQLESLASTIFEEEEPELRQKQSEKSEPSSNAVPPSRPLSLQPTRPGAISRLALSRTTSGERSPLSVAAPRRSQSFVLGLEAAPGGGSLVNSVAGSVHKHRQQFLQRRSMFEAPTASLPRRNSRPFEIELRALKLGTRTLDGDEQPAVQVSRRQSWTKQQSFSDVGQNKSTERQSAPS